MLKLKTLLTKKSTEHVITGKQSNRKLRKAFFPCGDLPWHVSHSFVHLWNTLGGVVPDTCNTPQQHEEAVCQLAYFYTGTLYTACRLPCFD